MLNRISTVIVTSFLLISIPGLAVGDLVKDVAKQAAGAAFSEVERQAIEKYYETTAPYRERTYKTEENDDDQGYGRKSDHRKKHSRKDKEYGKRGNLPKGIRKKLERGGTLPPGIAKRNLPGDLERQLPPVPAGYERIETNEQVLLRNLASGVIADVINIGLNSTRDTSRERPVETPKARDESATTEKSGKQWWQFWKD